MEEKNLPVLFTPNFQIEKQLKPIEYLFFIRVQIETRQLCKGFSFIEWLLCCCYTQQVQADLSYATSCKKLYQRYKAYG